MYVRTPSDLGSAIREQRRRLNISQQKLADAVGVSRQWLVEVERGKPRAEMGLVLKTITALGLRVALDDGNNVRRSDRAVAPPPPDIDAIVARARKGRP
jgi:HTH-type transcriptional regulator / antitoxin HipB